MDFEVLYWPGRGAADKDGQERVEDWEFGRVWGTVPATADLVDVRGGVEGFVRICG